jgi:hypothetical protein
MVISQRVDRGTAWIDTHRSDDDRHPLWVVKLQIKNSKIHTKPEVFCEAVAAVEL